MTDKRLHRKNVKFYVWMERNFEISHHLNNLLGPPLICLNLWSAAPFNVLSWIFACTTTTNASNRRSLREIFHFAKRTAILANLYVGFNSHSCGTMDIFIPFVVLGAKDIWIRWHRALWHFINGRIISMYAGITSIRN